MCFAAGFVFTYFFSQAAALHLPTTPAPGGGVGGKWGGGLAPADSEVWNLHLIAVCQPMI